MLKFVVRRLLQMVLVFFGATIILFSALFLFGNPVNNLTGTGRARTPAVIQQLDAEVQPRQADLRSVLQVRRGSGRPVRPRHQLPAAEPCRSAKILPDKLANTAKLALFAIIIEIFVGIARRRHFGGVQIFVRRRHGRRF